jgi:hypothetical protein
MIDWGRNANIFIEMKGEKMVRRNLLLAVALVALFVVSAVAPAIAQTNLREDTSLKLIPADAAMYGTSLRNRQIFDKVMASNAVARLKTMPVMQMALEQMKEPMAQYEAMLADPAVKEINDLVIEMLSDEIFVYGSGDWGELFDVFQEVNAAQQWSSLEQLQGIMAGGPGAEDETAQLRAVLESLEANADRVRVPDLVIGCKVESVDSAKKHLKMLEGLAAQALAQEPMLQGRLKPQTIGSGEFLVLTLDGSMVPWKEIDFEEIEEHEGQYDELVDKLKKKTLTVSLGVMEGYVLLSIGDNNDHLAAFGQGDLLVDRLELEPLRKHANRDLTSIGYTSEAFISRMSAHPDDMDELKEIVAELIPADLGPPLRDRILNDLAEFADDIKGAIPKPGAHLQFAYLGDKGFEGYIYNWTENLSQDASKPLSLLNHVGGDPIAFSVNRTKQSPQSYETFTKWIQRLFGYGDDFARGTLAGDDLELYDRVMNEMLPLVKRLDAANRDMLIPALADGQTGVVFDMKTASKQWHMAMPPAEQPLPAPELAIIAGISDADLLKKGIAEYYHVANSFIAKLAELSPEEVPLMTLPAPQQKAVAGGESFFYPLPPEIGLDSKFFPNAGLSESVLALAVTLEHTERLLTKTTVAAGALVAEHQDKPLASASHFDMAGMLDAVAPWIEYGIRQGFAAEGGDTEQMLPFVLSQLQTGTEILKCCRGFSSVTYLEDGATVTRFEWRFEDLP